MKVYLSGPMTGRPDHNRAQFDQAAADLRRRGYEVVSPAELDHNAGIDLDSDDGFTVGDAEYEQYIERDLEALDGCDAVVFLEGWSTSGGAGREGRHAIRKGMALFIYMPERPLLQMGEKYFLAYSTVKRKQPA